MKDSFETLDAGYPSVTGDGSEQIFSVSRIRAP
jgi:hypothetical protein